MFNENEDHDFNKGYVSSVRLLNICKAFGHSVL